MSKREFGSLLFWEIVDLHKLWKLKQTREDVRVARVCHAVAVSMGSKALDGRPLTLAHFMPQDPSKRRPRRTPGRVLLAQFMALTSRLNHTGAVPTLPQHGRP
jgi:hypothetical protein